MSVHTRVSPALAPAVGLLGLLFAACGGGKADNLGRGATAQQGLECERLGYPCAEADVAPEVAREGIRIGFAALDRFQEETGNRVLEWVRHQAGVVHAIGSGNVLRFRLKGGRPVWVASADALRQAPPARSGAASNPPLPEAAPVRAIGGPVDPLPPRAPGPARTGASASRRSRLSRLTLPVVFALEPVGRDRDQDNEVTDRDHRRALVLDPFRWQWTRLGTSDKYHEGQDVTRMLEATPGFRAVGAVDYRPDGAAGEDAFRGWDQYDVVHFSGHALRICEEDGFCYTVLFTGHTRSASAAAFDDSTLGPGRETAIFEVQDPDSGKILERRRNVALGRDWFTAAYAGKNLKRTLVFLNACGAVDAGRGFVPDFLTPLAGESTTIVGWDDFVPVLKAQTAALSFYQGMIADGLRAGDVMKQERQDNLDTALNSDGHTAHLRSGSGKAVGFSHARLRVREVVALYAPGGDRIVDGVQPIGILKGTPGDGKRDSLNVDLVVEGVEPQEQSQWSMDLVLNGRPIRRGVHLSPATKTGDHTYRVPLRNVPLGTDLKGGQRETLEAVAALPEGGDSRFKVEIEFLFADIAFSGTVSGGYKVRSSAGLKVGTGGTVHPDACSFYSILTSGSGDSLTVAGFVPPPLRTGIFPIGDTHGSSAVPVGTVVLDLVPSAARSGAASLWASGMPHMGSYSGSFEVTAVSPAAISGRFEAAIGFSGARSTITGEFALPLTNLAGFGRLAKDHPCAPDGTSGQ
jgi:hypothetical protein